MTSSPKLNKFNSIIKKFDDAGVPVVVVGGCVRDVLLGKDSSDIDLATPMPTITTGLKDDEPTVTELMKAAGYKVSPTGVKHGTVTVHFSKTEEYEVTTYRKDINCNGRDADVEFVTDLNDDLGRRDFTINAMAWNGAELVDPYGGYLDLRLGIIRAVGLPQVRFREDYLRVIRAPRFASYLGFTIDDATYRAAMFCKVGQYIGTHELVSFERVIDEFNKVFKRADQRGCTRFIKDMYDVGVLTVLLPELDLGPKPCHELAQSPTYHPEGDVLTHIAIAVGCAEGVEGRWIALLHDIAKPTTAAFKVDKEGKQHDYYSFHKHDTIGADMIRTSVKDRLPLSNDLINKAALCAHWHLYIYKTPPSSKTVRKVQAAMGEHLPLLRALGVADHMGRPISDEIDKYFEEQDVPVKPILLGRHLQEDGWEPGPHFGPALKAAFDVQLDEGVTDLAKLLEVANGKR